MEGAFKDGKPFHIIEFRQDGTKDKKFWYRFGTSFYTRANYYNEAGTLDTYEVYQVKSKRKTVVKTFTADGKRIEREVVRHTIEK